LSAAVTEALTRPPTPDTFPVPAPDVDLLGDDDAQLALWCCYELVYSSFAGVDDAWEWEPSLLTFRRDLEHRFVDRLVEEVGPPRAAPTRFLELELRALAGGDGPSLSVYALEHGTNEQFREFLVHRSAYQRKEADPHTWVLPRLPARAKAAVVRIQHDEYGAGDAEAMHAELFGVTLKAFGLDPAYGAYIDLLPGTTLATDNLVTLFGLHRRWRGACVGHLALFETTSVVPMGRYARTVARLGGSVAARRFYDEHVHADALHEQIALDEMVGSLVADAPELAGDVLFGARALAAVEQRFTAALLDAWAHGRTSLLEPLPASRAAS
jgi:hypothetical protein